MYPLLVGLYEKKVKKSRCFDGYFPSIFLIHRRRRRENVAIRLFVHVRERLRARVQFP